MQAILKDGDKDALHLGVKGYQVWATTEADLTNLLGPPAREDHAPPATGDPKVANRSAFSPMP